jgi:pimeloyl-ACP methyl ester carboxylesterase
MHYLHAGAARPVVLIHGLVGSSDNWRKNIGVLAQEASVYAIDLVNAGTSERIAGLNAQLDATADRVAAAMDALGIENADIVGHSHGGAVALMLAARHPERVRSLILFAPANPFCRYPDPMIRFYSSLPGQLLGRCGPYLPRQIQLTALGRMYGDPKRIGQGCIDGYVAGLRVPGTVDHILAIVRGWFADMALLRAGLPLVANVPTLIVWGDRDRAVSVASGKQLQRELHGSELAVVEGAGHVVFEELPVESNQLMLDWLRRDFAFDSRDPSDQDEVAAWSEDRSRPVIVAVDSVPSAQMPQLQPRA